VDGRTDVFSLGVVAYEMLLAKLPYGGGSFIDIGVRQAAGAHTVDTGDLAPALADAIRRAIAFEKDKRPASPAALAEEIQAAL
jgi:serine/threonine-protein kinase